MNDRVKYWFDLAVDDIAVAQVLLNGNKLLYVGFMCHLAVEKALKAKIESAGTLPPKSHNLNRLAELGGILSELSDEQIELLDILNPLQIEARYPAYKQNISSILTKEQCEQFIQRTREIVEWIE